MEWLVTLLNFFGITPDKYPSLVLGIWILALALWQNSKINKMGASINATLAKIKSNIKVIVTFLATMYPEKFDTRLIEAMIPKANWMLKDMPSSISPRFSKRIFCFL